MSKTVVITGCSRGIGRTLAEHYITEGWNVIATARDVSKLAGLKAHQKLALDVTSEESIAAAAAAIGTATPVHLLINNAGIVEVGGIGTLTKKALMSQMDTNAIGPVLVTQALLGNLGVAAVPGAPAVIAHITSQMGSIQDNSSGNYYGYRGSKAALNAYSKSMAIDLKEKSIAVLLLHPGYVKTDMSPNGYISQQESVSGMAKIIAETLADGTLSKTGGFFNQAGATLPW
ncbi:hypothetical protein HDU78_011456 [Chytriomyces hyalinus]|nr:hypothetical protein HDU78_011456 [Chytriomyces hyalinus]KAJ3250731.1 hypothetical protein HDU77_006421 [Chytriomyces hyalinus]